MHANRMTRRAAGLGVCSLVLAFVLPGLLGCAQGRGWSATALSAERAAHLDASGELPAAPESFRGLWVATVANIDWPSEPGLSPRAQREEMRAIVDLATRLNCNAIVLQVRPMADAIYPSELEPSSWYVTGEEGASFGGVFGGRDPLGEWLDAAHAAGLELHAWINPFRAGHPAHGGETHESHVAIARPELVRTVGAYRWMDPGEPEARAHSLAVVEDLVRRYGVDGVHMDDYFYPYPDEDHPFDDARTFAAHAEAGQSLSDWRRSNIDTFVREMYELVQRERPAALVGISPFGIWRPGNPEGIVGFDAYEGLHADARRWVREGWLDYASPQLYWKIESEGQSFDKLLGWWSEQSLDVVDPSVEARHVWPGLYLTRIMPEGSERRSWEPEQIRRQIERIERHPVASGEILFSTIGLLENRRGASDELASTVYREGSVVPGSAWLDVEGPGAPRVRAVERGGVLTLRVRPGSGEAVRRWLVRTAQGAEVYPGSAREITMPAPWGRVFVTAVGGSGVVGGTVELRAE
ncbi:MAG: family 10 glycosylhydrolase [Planctomycetota bacterium]